MNPAAPLPTPVDVDVSVLQWPAEETLRHQLAWFRMPRVLLVDSGVHPPGLLDELEDWMREPGDPIDLRARCAVLRQRATDRSGEQPILDDDGLLWAGSRWVSLTPMQAPVLQLLLDNLGRVVRFDTVVAAYERTGGSGHKASVRTVIARLGHRVRFVGLDLVSVRRRGVLLTLGGGAGLSQD